MLAVIFTIHGATEWEAPECKTWVWMSRNTFKRTNVRWMGNVEDQRVVDANEIVLKITGKRIVAFSCGLQSVTEQPIPSLMNYVPHFARALNYTNATRTTTFMGDLDFGGESAKGLKLMHNAPWVHALARNRPSNPDLMRLTRIERNGRGVTGLKQSLSKSQTYTPLFGFYCGMVLSRYLRRNGIITSEDDQGEQ